MPRVASLHLYPVKSLRGIDVSEVAVERRGFAHDRRFMVVDPDGKFRTQREMPIMATVGTALDGDTLLLTFQGESVAVPLEGKGERLQVRVWNSEVEAVHVPEAEAFLSHALEVPSRLVRMPETTLRLTSGDYSQPGDHVSFADGFPVLLANRASLDDLNAHVGKSLLMNRFRPNLVIEDAEPWDEDEMERIEVAGIPFRNAKPCLRCSVTTIDQQTGEGQGPEPLKTLAGMRRYENGVRFGINLIPDAEGLIRIGDRVQSE